MLLSSRIVVTCIVVTYSDTFSADRAAGQ